MNRLPREFEITDLEIDTPFGVVPLYRAAFGDLAFVFLSRHGLLHGIAPHQVNYRANIAALSQLGINRIVATNAVGSLSVDLPPGTLALLDDFIDFTRNRPATFRETDQANGSYVTHTDFSEPYCPELRQALISAAGELDVPIVPNCTYLCAEGPRFESPAEIRMFAMLGGDVVGMTGLPEAVFAREAGICYSGLAIVTNYGAGLTNEAVDHGKVVERMGNSIETGRSLIMKAALLIPEQCKCGCCRSTV